MRAKFGSDPTAGSKKNSFKFISRYCNFVYLESYDQMLRFSLGVTRMDKIRNEYIRGTAQVGKFGEKTREARLRWYGHLRRKEDGYIGRRMLRMELPGKRKRGRPKRRFMDVVKEDMAEVEVTEEDTVDRRNWRKKIRCGDP